MNYVDNDTLNANQQNTNQENETQQNAEKSKNKNAMVAKLLAGGAAGAVAGAGATYAAATLFGNGDYTGSESEPKQTVEEAHTAEQHSHHHTATSGHNGGQQHSSQQQSTERQQVEEQKPEDAVQESSQPKPTAQQTSQTSEEPEIKIESVETRIDNEGNSVHFAAGTVDGHQAVFVDDGNGNLVVAAIDVNDNGNVDENEVIDLRESNMTMGDLAQYRVEAPEPEVQVVAVEHDVDMDGQMVDVAAVSIDGENAILVDTEQDNEVNFVIADRNSSGTIEDEEVVDVSNSHIPMPSADDVTGNVMVSDEAPAEPDYSNDANVEMYDV